MLNHSQEPPQPKPQFITMKNSWGDITEIPVEQENIVAIFKSMGYRGVPMTEPDDADEAKQ